MILDVQLSSACLGALAAAARLVALRSNMSDGCISESNSASSRASTSTEPDHSDSTYEDLLTDKLLMNQKKAIVSIAWDIWFHIRSGDDSLQNEMPPQHNIYVISALLSVMLRAGSEQDVAHALKVAMESNARRDDVFYNTLLDACADAGQPEACHAVINMMQNDINCVKEQPTSGSCSTTEIDTDDSAPPESLTITARQFNPLLRYCAKAGGAWAQQKVWQLLHDMRAQSISPDEFTMSILLTACETSRDPDRAVEVLRMTRRYARLSSSSNDSTLRVTPALMRHAHRVFNQRWAWRRRPHAVKLLWSMWLAEFPDSKAAEPNGFPWWPRDRPVGAPKHVGRRI